MLHFAIKVILTTWLCLQFIRLCESKLGQWKNCSNSNNFRFEPNQLIWKSTRKLTLQSALIFEATNFPGLSACGLTVVESWPHTNHCGVQYISAVSANWAIPPGFGIIKPPQDMYSVTKRGKHERCVGECETEGEWGRKSKREWERLWWPWQPHSRVVHTVLDFGWGETIRTL